MRSLREAFTASGRAPLLSILGVVTIAFSIFAFGLFGLVAINIRKALEQVEQRVEVRAFVSDSTDIESVAAAMKDIGEFPEVLRVDYVSKEEALTRAAAGFERVRTSRTGKYSGRQPAMTPLMAACKRAPGATGPSALRRVSASCGPGIHPRIPVSAAQPAPWHRPRGRTCASRCGGLQPLAFEHRPARHRTS